MILSHHECHEIWKIHKELTDLYKNYVCSYERTRSRLNTDFVCMIQLTQQLQHLPMLMVYHCVCVWLRISHIGTNGNVCAWLCVCEFGCMSTVHACDVSCVVCAFSFFSGNHCLLLPFFIRLTIYVRHRPFKRIPFNSEW